MSSREPMEHCDKCGASVPAAELVRRGRLLVCEECKGDIDRKAKTEKEIRR